MAGSQGGMPQQMGGSTLQRQGFGNVTPPPSGSGGVVGAPNIAKSITPDTGPVITNFAGPMSGFAIGEPRPDRAASGGKGGGAPAQQYAQGGNVFEQSAGGMTDAMNRAYAESNYQPMNVRSQGYRPSTGQATGYGATTGQATGYNAAQAGTQGAVNAQNVQAGQIANTDLTQYTNPYETQVVQAAMGDITRQLGKQTNALDAQAGAAGAFGGSRHGVAQGELNAQALQQMSDVSSKLRQAGFQNAQQLAGQDIATNMQAQLANQGANLQAGQFNANLGQQVNLANQAATNQARQFGAGAQNAMTQMNMNAMNQANQFGAGAQNAMTQANMGALNQAGQFNAGQNLQAQLANQQAGLQGSQQRLGAAGQLGSLANIGFGMGQQVQQGMSQAGAQQQAIQQALIDAAKAQYGGYTGYPLQTIGLLSQALGASPTGQTQTNARQLGAFDYATMLAMMAGGF